MAQQDIETLSWSVDVPALLNEIIPNASPDERIYRPILSIFRSLLGEVAQRATELHDDKLDILMLRLNLYEMEGNNLCEKNKNRIRLIEQLSENIKRRTDK